MRILARPLLAALLAAVGMVLAGCPEKPPEPRTAAPVVTPPPAAPASAAAPAAVAMRGLPEVVGINSQIYTRTGGCMGVSFAIPIEVAFKVSEELREHGFVTRGRIGVVVQPMTPEIAERAGLEGRGGAMIAAVEASGPAHKASVAVGDVVLAFGGTEIGDDTDLARLVADARPGTRAKAKLRRDGRRVVAELTVAATPRHS